VTATDGAFAGFVGESLLRRTQAEGGGDRLVTEIAEPGKHVYPDHALVRAVTRMNASQARLLAVLARAEPHHLVGVLTLGDVVRAQANAVSAAGGLDASISPERRLAK
jgi:CBS domain-containing protein